MFAQLAPLSLLRLTAPTGRSIIARVADWGTGGPPIDGHVRAVDLWWQTSNMLGLPGTSGAWAGLVRIARHPKQAPAACSTKPRPPAVASDSQADGVRAGEHERPAAHTG